MNFKSSKIRWVMALSFALVITLAVAITIMSIHGARADSSPTGASIASDQADYQPGSTVTLTGAGWASGEVVQIYVNDSVGNTWSLTSGSSDQPGVPQSPVAGTDGSFTYSFSLPNWFVANYSATATGSTSGTATTTFTDNTTNCPSSATDPQVHQGDPNVSATFTATSSDTATYTFKSLVVSSGGGLIEYCVYNTPVPTGIAAIYPGWDPSQTLASPFGFIRGKGNNVPFDGNPYDIGTATFSGSVPTSPTFVLHVLDPAFCNPTNDPNGSNTCFVTPGTKPTAQDLTVSKTATPSFTRTFKWGITKGVDNPTPTIPAGGTGTFNYTVNVKATGADKDWQVNGTITVTNPNSFNFVGVNITDNITGVTGATCAITDTNGGLNETIKSGDNNFPYTCTYSTQPAYNVTGTNTAKASWDQATYNTPDGSKTGTHTFTFNDGSKGNPTLVDNCVTVTDTYNGGNPDTLGTVCAGNSPAPTNVNTNLANFNLAYDSGTGTFTFTYSRSEQGTPGVCTDYKNTAMFKTDGGVTGSDSKTATLCVAEDLTVTKDATPTFTRTYTWGITKGVDQNQINTSGSAKFTYTVKVTHDQTDGDWQVNGTITITNPNDFESISGIQVTDTVGNGDTCVVDISGFSGTLAPSGSKDLPYRCTYKSAPNPSDGTNTATATWDQAAASTPTDTASGTAPVKFSTTSPALVDNCVAVKDTLGGTLGTVCVGDKGEVNNTFTFTYPYTFTGDPAGKCTSHDNTATFTTDTRGKTGSATQTVTVCVGADLTVSKTAIPTFTRTFTWGISKSVDNSRLNIPAGGNATFNYTVNVTHDSGTDGAWQVTGTITVTNPNDWEDIVANVSDAVDNGGVCTVPDGNSVLVPANGSAQVSYSCTYNSAPTSSSGINTAKATWDESASSTPDGSASGHADFTFGDPTTIVDDSVTVNDTLGGPWTVSYKDSSPTTFNYSHTFSGDPAGTCTKHDNTASFTTDTSGTTGSDSKTVTVCVGANLTVSKTANTAYVLTYGWGITKNVDKTLVEQVGGGTATFKYTVEVTHDNGTPSNWAVSGTITVKNPNDWEAIPLTGVTDAVDNGATSCTFTNATATVPAGGSVPVDYTCTYNSAPSKSSGTNTATASWDPTAAHTPTGSASGTAPVDFSTATVTVKNGNITVVDDKTNPKNLPVTLGTASYTQANPIDFTYPLTLNVPTTNCKTYTNTATIVETGQTAQAKVEVCGPANTGALTMGFWQNKNGQGIITSGASTAGVCNSATWLRQYAPFQDLSATSSCSQVASYVLNIIKAANASGSSMNAMLKAQMLATALDVYFSDPAQGGNKINAPAPIGGVKIDLTKICAMIDGSSGTATCSGNYENVSSAFGGATSLTVSQMLAYAASQSNVGGSAWYGQVKATQQLAKDAFDAINNQVAFAP